MSRPCMPGVPDRWRALRPMSRAAWIAAIAVAYFAAAKLGFQLAFATKQVTAVWPPTALAAVAYLLIGRGVWPGVFLGAFWINAASDEPLWTAAGIAAGNTAAGLVGIGLMHWFDGEFDPRLQRARSVLGWTLFAAAAGCVVSATNGVAQLALGGIIPWAAAPSVWWVWWVGDAMGVLLLGPLLLTMARPSDAPPPARRRMEAGLLFAALAALCFKTFAQPLAGAASPLRLEYAVFPLIIWIALRRPQRDVAAAVVLVCGFALWGTIHGSGPFALGTLDQRLILLELFMAATSLTGLMLGAVTAERRTAKLALQAANDELEARVQQRTAELAATNRELRRVGELFQLISENTSDMITVTDPQGAIRYVSPACRHFYGRGPQALHGLALRDLVPPDDRPLLEAGLGSLSPANARLTASWRCLRPDASAIWAESTFDARFDPPSGAVGEVVQVTRDITERKATQAKLESSLREKEVLLKEVHHRVKNNMQVISSLLQLQSGYIETAQAKAMFQESQNRIKSMALIHEKLYQTQDFAQIDFSDYVHSLVGMLAASGESPAGRASVDVRAQPVRLDIERAVPAALVLHELVSNSLRHAFPDGRRGSVVVELAPRGDARVALSVRDDGVGLPAGFDPETSPTLGVKLVQILADQLGAELSMRQDNGSVCELVFDRLHGAAKEGQR